MIDIERERQKWQRAEAEVLRREMVVVVAAERRIEKGQRSFHEVQLHVTGVECGSKRFVVFSYWEVTTERSAADAWNLQCGGEKYVP